MYIFLIVFHFISFVSAETNKPYEGYTEIVERLSNYKHQKVSHQLSTTVPRERFHVTLGLTNTSTTVNKFNMGSVSHTGFLMGAAMPLIEQQLFFEVNAKLYQSIDDGPVNASLQQFDVRVSHKEPLEFAILNMGAGLSTRFLNVSSLGDESSYRIPSLMFVGGLERRMSQRVSLAGDIGYHRSFKNDPNGKNTFEMVFRLNYHL